MMTPDGKNERDLSHRGRRQSDQILDGWTWGRVIKIGTALTVVGAIVMGAINVIGTMIATKPQLNAVESRLRNVELRQDAAEQVHELLPSYFRLACIQLERDKSSSLAEAAGFPCDSLLRRIR